MAKMIFVNLPASDVERTAAFHEALGATRDARFSMPGYAAAMVYSDAITFMVQSHDSIARFTDKTIADARTTTEVLLCLSEDSREAVDATLAKVAAAGGKPDISPTQEMGDYMYGRSFEDPDGHIFEVMWMDVEAAMKAWGGSAAAAEHQAA